MATTRLADRLDWRDAVESRSRRAGAKPDRSQWVPRIVALQSQASALKGLLRDAGDYFCFSPGVEYSLRPPVIDSTREQREGWKESLRLVERELDRLMALLSDD